MKGKQPPKCVEETVRETERLTAVTDNVTEGAPAGQTGQARGVFFLESIYVHPWGTEPYVQTPGTIIDMSMRSQSLSRSPSGPHSNLRHSFLPSLIATRCAGAASVPFHRSQYYCIINLHKNRALSTCRYRGPSLAMSFKIPARKSEVRNKAAFGPLSAQATFP